MALYLKPLAERREGSVFRGLPLILVPTVELALEDEVIHLVEEVLQLVVGIPFREEVGVAIVVKVGQRKALEWIRKLLSPLVVASETATGQGAAGVNHEGLSMHSS